MKYQDIGAKLTEDNWNTIAEHSDVEKSILLGVVDYGLSIADKGTNFSEDLMRYTSIQLKGLSNLNNKLGLETPVTSIMNTTNEILDILILRAPGNRMLLLNKIRDSVLKSTKVSYHSPFRVLDRTICIMEINMTFNVKYVMNKSITKLICDYKEKVIIASVA